MIFDAIFLTLFFLAWTALGTLPWLGWSLHRRAVGALWALPFALLGGAGGGVLVPLVGLDNAVGVGVSMASAFVGGVLLTSVSYSVWDVYRLSARFRRFAITTRSITAEVVVTEPAQTPSATLPDGNSPIRVPRPQKSAHSADRSAGRQEPPPIDSSEPADD